jgi:YVTN family beta-propeller protein
MVIKDPLGFSETRRFFSMADHRMSHLKLRRKERPLGRAPGALLVGLLSLLLALPWSGPGTAAETEKAKASGVDGGRTISREGITLDLVVERLGKDREGGELRDGDDIVLGFKVRDTATGAPMTSLQPAAWIDPHTPPGQGALVKPGTSCQDKIKQFLQGSLAYRPEMDLNTYHILALNDRRSISVIDPHLGFYVSKLITSIPLKSNGEDWVLADYGNRLFVTLPKVSQVAVIDTRAWKVLAHIDAPENPRRIALQPDGKYLWVGNDGVGSGAHSGVTVVDWAAQKVAAVIPTGPGHHEIAFSNDSSTAYVSNADGGTVSLIDVARLEKVKDIRTGENPVSMAFSSAARALYTAHSGDGRITVIGGGSREVMGTIEARPGLRSVRFSPDGRWGFVTNTQNSTVTILDAATNRVRHTVGVDERPDQIAFSSLYAYIRALGSDHVVSIQLSQIEGSGNIPVVRFPAGQKRPEEAASIGLADAVIPTPERDVMLIANPADKTIYYYMEGMLAPMGSFQTYGHEPRGILVVDRSLKETAPGYYSTNLSLPHSGTFDVAYLMDNPRLYHCFKLEVGQDPNRPGKAGPPIRIEFMSAQRDAIPGQELKWTFMIVDAQNHEPVSDLRDVQVITMLASGTWQNRAWAEPRGQGVYEASITVPGVGVYQTFFQCASKGVGVDDLPRMMFEARETPPGKAGP